MKNILICEDDPVQLKVLLAAFSRAGYATAAARSPGQALRQLEENKPDVIVSDVRLEEGDAFELLEGAKRIGLDAPLIMISAYSTDVMRAEALKAGAVRFFEKSANHKQLVDRVDEVVRATRAARLGARVLILDKDAESAEALATELDSAGFDTLTAEDGAKGLSLARAAQPGIDFAVVRGTTGLQGTVLIKALGVAVPGIYVLGVGATPSRDELRAIYQAGAQAFFRTPLALSDLASHLRATLGRARRMRRDASRDLERRATPRRRLKTWLNRHDRRQSLWIGGLAVAFGLLLGALCQGVFSAAEEEARRAERALQRMEQRTHLPAFPCSHPR